MTDMPPECPPGMTVTDVISIQSQHIINNTASNSYFCFIQTPDDMKGKELKGYPYFDFEAARKQNSENAELQPLQTLEMSSTEFYLTLLLGGVTFLAFVIGFATGFVYLE
ncbi:TPA: hypothetical protein G9F27_005710 [Salmonella enterica]|uniref:Uncharacterized protein n=1 Tax=Salmonella enterica TaxID=28901 RepID=A0A743SNB8_SALER|nr:hypothetical protein [Salmonella enterica]